MKKLKKKHRQHYHQTKRLVKDLSPREKRNANTIWRLRQREYRQRKKNLQTITTQTPPTTPLPFLQNIQHRENPTSATSSSSNSARAQADRRIKHIRAKMHREKKKLEEKMQSLKQKCEKLRKRLSRSKKKFRKDETTQLEKKYKLLTTSIRKKYRQVKHKKQKILLRSLLKADDIVNCRSKNELLNDALGINRAYVSKTTININANVLKKKIHRFFLRDDISRPTAGKRETITRNKNKMQKRFLLPLSSLRVLKDIQNTLPRTSFYQSVYGNYPSSDDEDTQDSSANKENFTISKNDSFIDGTNEAQPSSSYKDCSSKQVSVDDFLHVFVNSDNLKKKRYSYVCKALTPVEEDGEVKVVFLRVAGKKDARLFRLDERDINYVDSEDIIKILSNPTVVKKGLRVYYQFDVSIDVFEK